MNRTHSKLLDYTAVQPEYTVTQLCSQSIQSMVTLRGGASRCRSPRLPNLQNPRTHQLLDLQRAGEEQ